MADYNDLVKAIKVIARDSVESTTPMAVMFGTVVAEQPLRVQIDQKLTLEGDQLILCRTVTDYSTDMTVDHMTEKMAGGSGHASFDSHSHQYKGRKPFTVHHKLITGDKVVLLRCAGGQKFVVVDRI